MKLLSVLILTLVTCHVESKTFPTKDEIYHSLNGLFSHTVLETEALNEDLDNLTMFVEDVWDVIDNLTETHVPPTTTTTTTTTTKPYECPSDGKWVDGGRDIGCFWIDKHSGAEGNYDHGVAFCKSLSPPNSGMAEIHDADTQDFLYNQINAINHNYNYWWLGATATDGTDLSTWKWTHSGLPMTYQNWKSDQPNDKIPVVLNMAAFDNGKWADVTKTNNKLYALCQYFS